MLPIFLTSFKFGSCSSACPFKLISNTRPQSLSLHLSSLRMNSYTKRNIQINVKAPKFSDQYAGFVCKHSGVKCSPGFDCNIFRSLGLYCPMLCKPSLWMDFLLTFQDLHAKVVTNTWHVRGEAGVAIGKGGRVNYCHRWLRACQSTIQNELQTLFLQGLFLLLSWKF